MNDIKERYQEFKNDPFPTGIAGKEILGIDLVMLDTNTAGLIEKFIGYNYKLNRNDFEFLKRLSLELKKVTKELNGQQREYFSTLWNLSDWVISELSKSNRMIKKSDLKILRKEWKQHFKRIRLILNKWDPIGVADIVDDEYDAINFAAYSALINIGTTESIKTAIKKYLNEAIGIDETDEKLNEVSLKIKNAVEKGI